MSSDGRSRVKVGCHETILSYNRDEASRTAHHVANKSCPTVWRATLLSSVHGIRFHGRRERGTAGLFSSRSFRQEPQEPQEKRLKGNFFFFDCPLCDLSFVRYTLLVLAQKSQGAKCYHVHSKEADTNSG